MGPPIWYQPQLPLTHDKDETELAINNEEPGFVLGQKVDAVARAAPKAGKGDLSEGSGERAPQALHSEAAVDVEFLNVQVYIRAIGLRCTYTCMEGRVGWNSIKIHAQAKTPSLPHTGARTLREGGGAVEGGEVVESGGAVEGGGPVDGGGSERRGPGDGGAPGNGGAPGDGGAPNDGGSPVQRRGAVDVERPVDVRCQ